MGSTLLGAIHVQVFSHAERKLMHLWIFPVHCSAKYMYRQGKHYTYLFTKGNVLYYQIMQTKKKKGDDEHGYLCNK